MRPLALMIILAVTACSQAVDDSNSSNRVIFADDLPIQIEQAWVASGFSEPEGVASDGSVIYISNVAGSASDKDGEGWISRLSMQGDVLDEKWVDGLNAPKGMAVRDGKLFVSDHDAYHVIDITSAEIEHTYPVEGAGFLNDVTVWQNGVYMSDSGSARIFQIDENGYKEWLADDRLERVNGLTADGDRLLIATMETGSLYESSGAQELTELASGMANADGIGVLDNGAYIVSSWPGQLWYVNEAGETADILNSIEAPINQNDLTRVGELIVVPNWDPGTVTAWRVSYD